MFRVQNDCLWKLLTQSAMCSRNGNVGAILLLFIIKGLIDSDSSATLYSIFFSTISSTWDLGHAHKEGDMNPSWRWNEIRNLVCGAGRCYPTWPQVTGYREGWKETPLGVLRAVIALKILTTHFSSKDHLCNYWEKADPDILGAKIPWPTKHRSTQKCLQNFLDGYLHLLYVNSLKWISNSFAVHSFSYLKIKINGIPQ